MNKIIILGSNGHIGKIITKSLAIKYEILAPTSSEVDILNKKELINFVSRNKDSIYLNLSYRHHKEDTPYQIYDHNIKMIDNIRDASQYFNRLIQIGSIIENTTLYNDLHSGKVSLMNSIYRETKLYAYRNLSVLSNCSYIKIAPCFGSDFFIDKFIQNLIESPDDFDSNNIRNNVQSHYLYIYDLVNILEAIIQSSDTLACCLCNNDFISRNTIADFIINHNRVDNKANINLNSFSDNNTSPLSDYIKKYKYKSIFTYINHLLNNHSVSKYE
ncbi:MAG: NAD-dependent epimerase/dehydratase family protein [Paludibacteraceae bacterium]|nr:NAD-dependent epimerase/dehydratase family protein [Paludibacteraceae bacterium]